jgi:hypothetical protein
MIAATCPHCGTALPDAARFCPGCAMAVAPVEPPAAPEPLFTAQDGRRSVTVWADHLDFGAGSFVQSIPLRDLKRAYAWGVERLVLEWRDRRPSVHLALGKHASAALAAIQAAVAASPPPEPPRVQVKEYKTAAEFEADAERMIAAGYHMQGQSATDGHINVGRTVTGAALTGGWSLLLGASRTKGKTTVTWLRDPPADPAP